MLYSSRTAGRACSEALLALAPRVLCVDRYAGVALLAHLRLLLEDPALGLELRATALLLLLACVVRIRHAQQQATQAESSFGQVLLQARTSQLKR